MSTGRNAGGSGDPPVIRFGGRCEAQDLEVIVFTGPEKLELDPTNADELEKLAKEVTSQSPEIIAKMKQLLAK